MHGETLRITSAKEKVGVRTPKGKRKRSKERRNLAEEAKIVVAEAANSVAEEMRRNNTG